MKISAILCLVLMMFIGCSNPINNLESVSKNPTDYTFSVDEAKKEYERLIEQSNNVRTGKSKSEKTRKEN